MLNCFIKFLLIIFFLTNSNFSRQSLANEIAPFKQGDKFYKKYIDWAIFSNIQANKKNCYIISTPLTTTSNANRRGQPYIIISKNSESLPEISVIAGYYYKDTSEVDLYFGLKKFSMMVYQDKGWTYDVYDDIEFIKSMRNSDDVIITSISSSNEVSSDTYSLLAFNKAYESLYKNCK